MDWLHFPGLFKYLTFLGVIAYAFQWTGKDIAEILEFDWDKILTGQVWRLFSFLFAPIGLQSFTAWGVFMLFFAVQLAFMISDSLEEAWGTTRTTLYILLGWGGLLVVQLLLSLLVGFSFSLPCGLLFSASMFFAFATLYPKVELMIMFILPVQVRILGWIGGIVMLLTVITSPWSLVLIFPAMLPYLLWVLPDVIHGRKSLVKAAQRRRKFQVASRPEALAFHRCESCGRTERDSEDLQFYTLPDGKEYCQEHLPPQA
ncbi:hypothetical protein [Luteolibacter soli]|uniref:Peptidase S54 rhomboid domain-containing protein n=1 Tax=Luteolibacter soli TaxID=3135280 RepID=A0ABU9AXZ1_9BACT